VLAPQEKEYEHEKEPKEKKEYKLMRKLHTYEEEKVGAHQSCDHTHPLAVGYSASAHDAPSPAARACCLPPAASTPGLQPWAPLCGSSAFGAYLTLVMHNIQHM
jgi:hypothetical protein